MRYIPDPPPARNRAPKTPEIETTSWLAVAAPPDAPTLGLDDLLAAGCEAKFSAAMIGPDCPPDDVWKFVRHESDRRRYVVLVFRREADRFEHLQSNQRAAEAGVADDRGTDDVYDSLAARAFNLAHRLRHTRRYDGRAHVWRFDPMAREIWIASARGTGTATVGIDVEPGADVLAMHGLQTIATLRSGRGVVLRFADSAASRAAANRIDAFVQRVAP